MNMDQVWSLIRAALLSLGSSLVANGYVDSNQLNMAVGAIVGLLTVAWGVYTHTKASKLAAAAKIPEVQQIVVTSQKTADAQGAKVVTPAEAGTTGLY